MSTEYIIHKDTSLVASLLFNFFALKRCADKIDNAVRVDVDQEFFRMVQRYT